MIVRSLAHDLRISAEACFDYLVKLQKHFGGLKRGTPGYIKNGFVTVVMHIGRKVGILTKFSEVFILTTRCDSDGNFVKMTSFPFQYNAIK